MTSEVPSSMPEQKKESTDSTSSSSGEDSTTCSSGTPADVATTGNKRKLEVKPMKPSKKQKMNNNSTTPTTANNDTSSATAAAVQEEEEEPIECSICYDKIVEQGCLDCCKHEFCFDCIFTWSKTSNACPICKQRFGSIQPASIHKNNNNNNNSSNSITNNGNSTDVTTNEAASTTRARVAVPTRNFRLIEDDYDDEDYEDEVLQYLPIFHQLLAASGFDGFDSDSDDDLPPGIHRAHPEHFFQLLAEGGRIRLLTRRTVQRHHNPTHQQPGSNRPEDPIVINSDDEEEPSPQNHTFPRDLPQFSTIPIQQQQDPDHGDILSFINSFPGQAGNITTTISNNINNGVRTTTTTRTFTITNNGNAGPAVMQPPTPLTTNHPGAMGMHAEQPNNVTLPRASHLLNTTNEHSIPPLNNISHHDPFMQGLIRPNLLSHSPPSPQIPPIHSHPISQPNLFNMTPANYFNPREPMGMRLNSVPFPPNNAGMPTPSFEPFRHHTVLPSLLSLPPPEHVNQFLQPQNTRSIPPLSNFLNNPPHNPGVPDIGNFRGQSTHSSPVHGSTLFDQISNRIFGNESRTGDIVADSLAIHRTLSSAFNELSTLAPLRNAPDQQPPPHPHHQHPPPPQQPSSNMNSTNNFGFMQNHDPSRQFREFQ